MTTTTIKELKKDVIHNPIYLLDQNTSLYFSTRPQKLFLDLADVLPIDSDDDTILEFSTKKNLIIVTSDMRFAVIILLNSKSVIFQTVNNERFYFKVKESGILSIPKKDIIEKIFGSINIIKNKKSYIADSNKTLSILNDIDVSNPNKKIKKFPNMKNNIQINVLIDYVKNSKSVLVTSSKRTFLKSLFALNECVYVDDESNINYISVEYFKFENVIYDRKKLAIRNYENKSSDYLHNNIRFIRKNIDEIEKNLNFLECELIRRKELEATITKSKLHSSTKPNLLGDVTFE